MKHDKRTHILVVEDNKDTQILLRYLLDAQFKLDIALNVGNALECANAVQYDLLLVDINLGEERTGIDLLHMLRASENYAGTPVVALTAYAMPGDYERFLELGFDAYLSKPFQRTELFDIIYSFIPNRIA